MTLYEISEEGLNDLLEMQEFPKSEMDITSFFKQREAYTVEDGIAFIHVFGPLVRNASDFDKKQSLTDYSDLEKELSQAANDSLVQYVVLTFDSPGGESCGSQEVTDIVQSFPKPTVGFVKGICASAAMKIASACTVIYSTVSSEIGSIGSIIVMTNTKEAMNKQGVKREIIFNNGAIYKGTGQDFGSVTEEQKVYLQNKVNQSASRFQEVILGNRPETDPITFSAAMYPAHEALELGLIDAIV